jgi:NAD(P)-dependent dehydrogenase (short-subunit alcohol dehydrogenase family)
MGRVAAVTGAANGIGRAVALRLVADGYAVAGLDIEEVAGAGITPFRCDVAEIAGHEQLIADIEARLGPLDALVNVAGISIPQPLAELDPVTYQRHLDVMVTGPVFLARAAGLRMAERKSGRIVNVTSIHGTHSEAGCVAYDVAKGGLEAGTRTLAIELGRSGVLVNSVAPGFVNTRMSIVDGQSELETDDFREIYQRHAKIALARASEPAEIAAAVAHLVSPDNTYITGARLLVDGGLAVTF